MSKSDPADLKKTEPKKPVSTDSFLRAFPKKLRVPLEMEGYIHLPETLAGAKASQAGVWRITLETVDLSYQALALEIAGDVTLGASASCDINANPIWGEGFGISKEHCKLRPTAKSLFLIDLESTNHTYLNGTPLSRSDAQSLAHRDLITLGRLHLRLKIVEQPPQEGQG